MSLVPKVGMTYTDNEAVVHIVGEVIDPTAMQFLGSWRSACNREWYFYVAWRGRVYNRPVTCMLCIDALCDTVRDA